MLVEKLQRYGITRLLDVRAVPLSRKRGFSKNILAGRLQAGNIAYEHAKELGTPTPIREMLKKTPQPQAIAWLFDEYERYLTHSPQARQAVVDARAVVMKEPCCLLCLEADPLQCHRHVVASQLQRLSPDSLQIVHL